MSNTVYTINKGINKAIEFKGLKAQYIWYLGGGLLVLMVLFAVMYISGLNSYFCLVLILTLGILLFVFVYRLSRKFGEHGLMKQFARKRIPKLVRSKSRKHFIQ